MNNIPTEYLDYDFGFTGVSEAEYEGQIKQVEQSQSQLKQRKRFRKLRQKKIGRQ
jgi:hypothetical protein